MQLSRWQQTEQNSSNWQARVSMINRNRGKLIFHHRKHYSLWTFFVITSFRPRKQLKFVGQRNLHSVCWLREKSFDYEGDQTPFINASKQSTMFMALFSLTIGFLIKNGTFLLAALYFRNYLANKLSFFQLKSFDWWQNELKTGCGSVVMIRVN